MRVIEPLSTRKKRRTPKKFLLKTLFFLCIILLISILYTKDTKAPSSTNNQKINSVDDQQAKPKVQKIFSAQQFRDLYNSYAYPNTQLISEESPITGNSSADQIIRDLALARGYKIRSAPVTDTFVDVGKGMLLQQKAAEPWLSMQNAAQNEGYVLRMSDGYRSAEDQRTIFNNRLKSISLDKVAAGQANNAVNEILRTTAVPGYSRHHSGYTIDLVCDNDQHKKFEHSKCFKWLSADNYAKAKQFGWIPSYPEGIDLQGPDPESWEYVWVGVEILYE